MKKGVKDGVKNSVNGSVNEIVKGRVNRASFTRAENVVCPLFQVLRGEAE